MSSTIHVIRRASSQEARPKPEECYHDHHDKPATRRSTHGESQAERDSSLLQGRWLVGRGAATAMSAVSPAHRTQAAAL
jgi:hypothetical protein